MPAPSHAAHEIFIERTLDASPDKVWRCWTEPALMVKWFTPAPFSTESVDADLRPGGYCNTTMKSPDGQLIPNPGQYLEVVPGKRLVFTDAFLGDWIPKEGAPFFVGIIELSEAPGGKTKYVARARHWTAEASAQHEAMGFTVGWNAAADQLEALARTL
jgi:uncharacterized protein YndB with AHSA1/START domain